MHNNRTKSNRNKRNRSKKQRILNTPEDIVNEKKLDIYKKDK